MDPKSYFLTTGNKIKRIDTDSLLYISVDNNLSSFFMEGPEDTIHHNYRSLKSIEADLPHFFIKVKQNSLVNGIKITELDTQKRQVTLKEE